MGVESVAVSGVGRVAARLDRLPVTWVQWRLALITQVFWGIVVAMDGIPAKIYPFVWGPQHAFGVGAFSLLLAVQFGVGILVGEYVVGMISDRYGRRIALLLSSLAAAAFLWPTALTNNFGFLLLFFGLSAMSIGGVLSTNVVYMGEIVPPEARGRIMLAAQILAVVIFGVLSTVPPLLWVPAHYTWVIYSVAIACVVVLLPLAIWALPESPRWLEAHGRHEAAEAVVAQLERECLQRARLDRLPDPDYAAYIVTETKHVPVGELLRGEYGRRTIILLICWILGYSGIVYGFFGYVPTLLSSYGLTPSQTFGVMLVATIVGGGVGLAISSWLGERVERKNLILVAAVVNTVALWLLFYAHGVTAAYLLVSIGWGAETVWLFNMYNYTQASYPTRLRATGTGLTDGFGHLGSIFGPIIAGSLFVSTASAGHVGYFAFITIPGALVPAILLAIFGIRQRRAILEQIAR